MGSGSRRRNHSPSRFPPTGPFQRPSTWKPSYFRAGTRWLTYTRQLFLRVEVVAAFGFEWQPIMRRAFVVARMRKLVTDEQQGQLSRGGRDGRPPRNRIHACFHRVREAARPIIPGKNPKTQREPQSGRLCLATAGREHGLSSPSTRKVKKFSERVKKEPMAGGTGHGLGMIGRPVSFRCRPGRGRCGRTSGFRRRCCPRTRCIRVR